MWLVMSCISRLLANFAIFRTFYNIENIFLVTDRINYLFICLFIHLFIYFFIYLLSNLILISRKS